MAVRFVEMVPELFWQIPLSGDFSAAKCLTPAMMEAACNAPNVAMAMLDGGKVLGAGGVFWIAAGRGLAWMLPGDWMTRRDFALAAAECRRQLGWLLGDGLHRIECTVLTGHRARARFIKRLGFAFEGTMRRFTPDGVDHDLWAMTLDAPCEQRSLFEGAA
jgi:hypothetical protein